MFLLVVTAFIRARIGDLRLDADQSVVLCSEHLRPVTLTLSLSQYLALCFIREYPKMKPTLDMLSLSVESFCPFSLTTTLTLTTSFKTDLSG